jgi:hypothetical protein
MAWVITASLVAGAKEEAASKAELTVPSEKVVKSFVTTAKEKPDSKESVELKVNFKPVVLPKSSMDIYRSKGKIPFTVSVELFKVMTTEEGIGKQYIFDSSANIVVVDKAGQIANRTTEDLSALCPS